jgi:hypothetical protein
VDYKGEGYAAVGEIFKTFDSRSFLFRTVEILEHPQYKVS